MKALLLVILISFNAHCFDNIDDKTYQQTIDDVNWELENTDFLKCPGTKLVVSCGNLLCEPHKNETQLNCPADCKKNVSIRSYNNITLCDQYTATHIPHNANEVQDLIKFAISKGKTVKAIGASHSATDIMCAEGIVIPMQKLDKVIGISKVNGIDVVEAQTGITVYELSEWLHKKNMALAGIPHMGFRDVTIGGAIATGSHGSSAVHTAVISNIVEAVEFIDGSGNKRYLERHSADKNEFRALSASLGLLGVMTKVKLRIQKQFNLAVNVSYHHEKEMFDDGVIEQVQNCDYGQLNWFPGSRRFVKTCGKKTTKRAYVGANNELLKPRIPKFIVNPFKKILQMSSCNNRLMCLVERVRYWQFKVQPPLVSNNRRGRKRNRHFVIGPAHKMVSSHLIKEQEGFFQMDWEIAVPASKAQAALKAIKKHTQQNFTCLPLVGVFIRFAPSESKTLIGHTHSDQNDWIDGEPAVFFEMPVYVPVGFSKERFEQYEKQFVDFAKLLIKDYSGRPHWAKNRDWTLNYAVEQGRYKNNLKSFYNVVNKFDPKGIFRNKLSDELFSKIR